MYCKKCGQQLDNDAKFCSNCGAEQSNYTYKTETYDPQKKTTTSTSNDRDWLISLLLCIFAGCLGIHSFYNGKIGIGIAQILTCGGCGLWTLIDIIMICTDNYKDCDGKPLVHKI